MLMFTLSRRPSFTSKYSQSPYEDSKVLGFGGFCSSGILDLSGGVLMSREFEAKDLIAHYEYIASAKLTPVLREATLLFVEPRPTQ